MLADIEKHIEDLAAKEEVNVKEELNHVLEHLRKLHQEYALFREMNG